MHEHYYVICRDCHNEVGYIDGKKLDGFHIKPLNQVEYDGIVVNKMVIINPSFIDKVLKRKIKRKLNVYLNYVISFLDENDETDPSGLAEILNDLKRYRSIVMGNYQKFLDAKYMELLLKKMDVIEQELKSKLIIKTIKVQQPVEEETHKKSR